MALNPFKLHYLKPYNLPTTMKTTLQGGANPSKYEKSET